MFIAISQNKRYGGDWAKDKDALQVLRKLSSLDSDPKEITLIECDDENVHVNGMGAVVYSSKNKARLVTKGPTYEDIKKDLKENQMGQPG